MIDIILAAGLEAEYAIYILVLKAFVTSTVQPNDPVGIKNFITSNFQSFLRSAESLFTSQSYHSDVSQLSGQTRTPDEWADWIFSPLSVQGPDVVRRYMIVDIWQAVSFRNESPLVNDVVKESERNAIDAFVQTFKVEENRKIGKQILSDLAKRGFDIKEAGVIFRAMVTLNDLLPEQYILRLNLMVNVFQTLLIWIGTGPACLKTESSVLQALSKVNNLDLTLRFMTVSHVIGIPGFLALVKSLDLEYCKNKQNIDLQAVITSASNIFRSRTFALDLLSVIPDGPVVSKNLQVTKSVSGGTSWLSIAKKTYLSCIDRIPLRSIDPEIRLNTIANALSEINFDPCGPVEPVVSADSPSYAASADLDSIAVSCTNDVLYISCLSSFGGEVVRVNRQVPKSERRDISCDTSARRSHADIEQMKSDCLAMHAAHLTVRMVLRQLEDSRSSTDLGCGVIVGPEIKPDEKKEICDLRQEPLVKTMTAKIDKIERYQLRNKLSTRYFCGSMIVKSSETGAAEAECNSWYVVLKSVRSHRWLREVLPKRFTTAIAGDKHAIPWRLLRASTNEVITFEGTSVDTAKSLRYLDRASSCQISVSSDSKLRSETVKAFKENKIKKPCGSEVQIANKAKLTEVPYYACFVTQRVLVLSCTAEVDGSEIRMSRSSDLHYPDQNDFTKRMTVSSQKSFECTQNRNTIVTECNRLVEQYLKDFSG